MSKPFSRKFHGALDYGYIALVAGAPQWFGFEDEENAARLCSVFATGTALYTLLTRYEWGAVRLLPFKSHLAVDVASGVLALAAPWLFGFAQNERARNTFLVMGAAGLVAGGLTEPEEMP